jgi:hypothetical protein
MDRVAKPELDEYIRAHPVRRLATDLVEGRSILLVGKEALHPGFHDLDDVSPIRSQRPGIM